MNKMIETHVRFDDESYKVIKQIAKENNMRIAEVVRLCVQGQLEENIKKVRTVYVKAEQGEAVLRKQEKLIATINSLTEETLAIKTQLIRIGTNFNQAVAKMKPWEKDKTLTGFDIQNMLVDMHMQSFFDELERLMSRYEDIVRKESTILWDIQK